MKPKELVNAAIQHQPVEKLPIALHNFLLAAELMEMPYSEIFQDSHIMAESQLRAFQEFGHDLLMVECGIASLAQACGCKAEYAEKTAPWITEPVFGDLSAEEVCSRVKNLDMPDLKNCDSTRTVIDAVKILVDKKGDELFIMGRADQGPFSLAAELRGMSTFLLDLACGESYIEDLLEYTTGVCTEYAKLLGETGCDATSMGESPAGPDVVPPDYYKKYAKGYEKKIIDSLHKEGLYVANHICGNVDDIFDDMVGTEADILEIDEKTNLESASKKAKGKNCLLGQLSPTLLKNGSEKDIISETDKIFHIMKGNPGFIMAAGCAISGDTPVENIKTFVERTRNVNI